MCNRLAAFPLWPNSGMFCLCLFNKTVPPSDSCILTAKSDAVKSIMLTADRTHANTRGTQKKTSYSVAIATAWVMGQ